MLNLTKYHPKPTDGGIVAYPIRHTRSKRMIGWREMEFTIRADLLELKEGEKADDVEEIDAPPSKKATKVEEKKKEEEVVPPKTEEKKEEAATTEKKEEKAEKDEL